MDTTKTARVVTTNAKFISDIQFAERIGVHRTTIWRLAKDANFPQPVKLTSGCTRWRLADVEAWEAAQEGVAA